MGFAREARFSSCYDGDFEETGFRVDSPRAAPISWNETRCRLKQDRRRVRAMVLSKFSSPPAILLFHPPYLCMVLYRTAHFFWRRGFGKIARFFTQLNSLVTGVDIHPHTELGGGMLIPHPVAVTVSGRAGSNFTMMPLSGIGMLPRAKDVGAGPGLPVLGDDVWLGPGCGVIGPLRVGDRSRVAAGAAVTRNVRPDCLVECIAQAAPVSPDAAPSAATTSAPDKRGPLACTHHLWQQVRHDIASDVGRYLDVRDPSGTEARGVSRRLSALLSTEVLVVAAARFAHFLWCNGFERFARAIAGLNLVLNRAMISAESCIGPGMFLGHPAGVVFKGSAGSGLTLYARSLCMPQWPESGHGGPVVGDRLVLAGMSAICGPVRIGNDVRVGFYMHVTNDVDDHKSVAGEIMTSRHRPLPACQVGPSSPMPAAQQSCAAPTLSETRERVLQDRQRLGDSHGGRVPWLPFVCTLLYRISHYCESRGLGLPARWFWRLNVTISGADIDPRSVIDGGLVIPNPTGISIYASAGRNLTVLALTFIGPESARDPVPDRARSAPRIGDDVFIGNHALVCGNVEIGSNAHIGPGVRVTANVPAGTTLAMPTPRAHARADQSRQPVGQAT